MRFSLQTLLAVTTAIAVYAGVHIVLARMYPLRMPIFAVYWKLVPTDIVLIIAMFLLYQSRIFHVRAVRYGIHAAILMISLSFLETVTVRLTLFASTADAASFWGAFVLVTMPMARACCWALMVTALLLGLRTRA